MGNQSKTKRNSRISLKTINSVSLLGVLTFNLVALITTIKFGSLLSANFSDIQKDWQKYLPSVVGSAVMVILNGLISSDMKARIIFLRWHNFLPGCFAFSKYAPSDPRIDISTLQRKVGKFPRAPHAQNALWYKLYKSVDDDVMVRDAQRHYLLARDWTTLCILLLIATGPIAFFQTEFFSSIAFYVGLLVFQILIAHQAARQYGIRFVTNVMAVIAARP